MGFAHLTPYISVGVRMAAIMLLSSIATIVFLPALIRKFHEARERGDGAARRSFHVAIRE